MEPSMTRARLFVITLATTAGLIAATASVSTAQIDQRAIAAQLLDGNRAMLAAAVKRAATVSPGSVGPELRAALLQALAREGRLHAEHYLADERGQPVRPLEDPELVTDLTVLVAQLRDRRAIPVLGSVLGIGSTLTASALASFGEEAVGVVAAIATDPDSPTYAVDEGLITLRFMVEAANIRPLSAASWERIRRTARQHLTGRQKEIGSSLRWAIDLAIATKDPGLRRIVESLATDRREITARGITDPDLVEQTRRRAHERLAGIPPRPHRP